MKKRKKKPICRRHKLWTLAEVQQVLPLVNSILSSIRHNYLGMRFAVARVKKISEAPGKLSRSTLIELEELNNSVRRMHVEVDDAVEELLSLGVLCAEPIQQVAFFLCMHKSDPAMFVYSPTDGISWRFDVDPIDTRRDLKELVVEYEV